MLKKLYENLFGWKPIVPKALIVDTVADGENMLEATIVSSEPTGFIPVPKHMFLFQNMNLNLNPEPEPKMTTQLQLAKKEDRRIPEYIDQWIPNDGLQNKYNDASKFVGQTPSIKHKIKECQKKIDSLSADAKRILDREDTITGLDRFHILEFKQDIMREEARMITLNLELEKASVFDDDPIFEDWSEYLMKAEAYLRNNPILQEVVGANDILNSQGIFVRAKQIMDSARYNPKTFDENINKIAILGTFINLDIVHKNARGQNLIEFTEFFSNSGVQHAQLELFDRLDIETLQANGGQLAITNTKVPEAYALTQ